MRFQTLFEGRLFFIIFVALLLLSGIFHWSFLGFLGLLGLIFCVNFFRDPDRPVPSDERAIVAAADGTVAIALGVLVAAGVAAWIRVADL